ncbi:hypothetical protein MHYP_G00185470 [Metynnis hypsauchen]
MLEMLGTLSLDDMLMSFGGDGVMPNDTKHLVTDLTIGAVKTHTSALFTTSTGGPPGAEKTCSSMSSTYPLPHKVGSFFVFVFFFFFFRLFWCSYRYVCLCGPTKDI